MNKKLLLSTLLLSSSHLLHANIDREIGTSSLSVSERRAQFEAVTTQKSLSKPASKVIHPSQKSPEVASKSYQTLSQESVASKDTAPASWFGSIKKATGNFIEQAKVSVQSLSVKVSEVAKVVTPKLAVAAKDAVSTFSLAANKTIEAGKAAGVALAEASKQLSVQLSATVNKAVEGTTFLAGKSVEVAKVVGANLTVGGQSATDAAAYGYKAAKSFYEGVDFYDLSKQGVKAGQEWWNTESDYNPLDNPAIAASVSGVIEALKRNADKIDDTVTKLVAMGAYKAAHALTVKLSPVNCAARESIYWMGASTLLSPLALAGGAAYELSKLGFALNIISEFQNLSEFQNYDIISNQESFSEKLSAIISDKTYKLIVGKKELKGTMTPLDFVERVGRQAAYHYFETGLINSATKTLSSIGKDAIYLIDSLGIKGSKLADMFTDTSKTLVEHHLIEAKPTADHLSAKPTVVHDNTLGQVGKYLSMPNRVYTGVKRTVKYAIGKAVEPLTAIVDNMLANVAGKAAVAGSDKLVKGQVRRQIVNFDINIKRHNMGESSIFGAKFDNFKLIHSAAGISTDILIEILTSAALEAGNKEISNK